MSETTTFAIGQRVRVIKHDTDGTQQDNDEALRWTGEIGNEGTIDRITDGDTRKLYEFRDDDGRKHVAFASEIEAVNPQDRNFPPATDPTVIQELRAAIAALQARVATLEPPTPAPANAVAPKLTPAKLRLSRQMRNALEVYAEPQYIVDGLTIETVDGHYVGMMDRRIQQSMCKRGFVADSSEITHKRTFAITDLGRAALESAS